MSSAIQRIEAVAKDWYARAVDHRDVGTIGYADGLMRAAAILREMPEPIDPEARYDAEQALAAEREERGDG